MRNAAESLEMFAVGAIVGSGLMFLMDPKAGRARRNYLRDKLIHGINSGRRQTTRFLRDKRNRARGVIARTVNRAPWIRESSNSAPSSSTWERLQERPGA
jgi:hypothetical protein